MQHATVSASLCYEAACMKANNTRASGGAMDTLTLQVQCLQVRQLAHLGRKGRCPIRAKLVACPQSSTKRRCTQS